MDVSLWLCCLSPVPPGGVDVNHWRDLPAHQLRLLCSLVLHRPGNLGDAHPSLSLPAPPETFQGYSVRGCCAKLARHSPSLPCTELTFALSDKPIGAAGPRRHLHGGLLLHRGSVSVLGPLEHGAELCSHTDRGPSLLCDRLPLSLAP